MNEGQYSAPLPRGVTLAAGIVSTFIGVPLAALGAMFIFGSLGARTPIGMIVMGCIALAVGAFMSLSGYRLMANVPRSDDGLVPPWALRVAGVAFLVGAPFAVWHTRSLVSVWHALGAATAGLACFGIASVRERNRG